MSFSFSFSGDDIEESSNTNDNEQSSLPKSFAAETGTLHRPASNSAFPIAGQALLKPQKHDLEVMLQALPSNISYSTLTLTMDDGTNVHIPRRELWDVRAQLMAEENDEELGNLGHDDVRTGVYEGGFKSWESSVDVVKVLAGRGGETLGGESKRVLELGCGTALPSMALFQWRLRASLEEVDRSTDGFQLCLTDYNPTVLQLVTLPNLILSWAYASIKGSWDPEGELEIDEALLLKFLTDLKAHGIALSFISGAWSPGFVQLVEDIMRYSSTQLTIIGAETIYSPFALKSFAETLVALLETSPINSLALVAAKKVYFGVGGSMEDFCDCVRNGGMTVEQIREESDGVRRAVVQVTNSLGPESGDSLSST